MKKNEKLKNEKQNENKKKSNTSNDRKKKTPNISALGHRTDDFRGNRS